jgi:hypothetical protein
MLDRDGLALRVIRNKKITNVNVAGPLPAGGLAITFHLDGALVILVKSSFCNGVALGFHKHFDKEGVREVVACADELGFGGTFGIDALLFGLAD